MPKITRLKPQSKNPHRISVWLDGKYTFGVEREVLEEAGIKEGDFLSQSKIENLRKKERVKKAKEYALTLLDFRPRSQEELKERLKKKGYGKEVEKVIKYLRGLGLVKDKDFALHWALDRKKLGYGPQKVLWELRKKGIEETLTKEVVEKIFSFEEEVEKARELLKKRERLYRGLEEKTKKRRIFGWLARRGFSMEVIKKVMEE